MREFCFYFCVVAVGALVLSWAVSAVAPKTQYCAKPLYDHVSEFETVVTCESGLVVRIAR